MPAAPSAKLQKLLLKTDQYAQLLDKKYPEISQFIQASQAPSTSQTAIPESELTSENAVTDNTDQLYSQISTEEYEAVLDKAAAIAHLPPGKIDLETNLYLEQQLSDLLGFQVATKLQEQELLHSHGVIQGLPHLKLSPTDSNNEHGFKRAPFSEQRGYYGWLQHKHELEFDPTEYEKYYAALPLYLLSNWQTNAAAFKQWYNLRKVIFINPHNRRAVVTAVVDTFAMPSSKYQFGASPETIIEGKFWSPQAMGKVLAFFIVETGTTIPLGPIEL